MNGFALRGGFGMKEALKCNVCTRAIEKDPAGYYEDHLEIVKKWGYHSPYDGEIHRIDVCIECYQSWVATLTIPLQVSCYFELGL